MAQYYLYHRPRHRSAPLSTAPPTQPAHPFHSRFQLQYRPPIPEPPPPTPHPPQSRIPDHWWEDAFADLPTPSEIRGHRCGEKQMLTLVAYDITDHKRLAQVARICEDFGMRIQYSVFECRLEADRFDHFWNTLLDAIDPASDRLVAYKICAACAKETRDAGTQFHMEKVVAYVF